MTISGWQHSSTLYFKAMITHKVSCPRADQNSVADFLSIETALLLLALLCGTHNKAFISLLTVGNLNADTWNSKLQVVHLAEYTPCALSNTQLRKLGLPLFLELWFTFYFFASPLRRAGTCSTAQSFSCHHMYKHWCQALAPESVQYGARLVVVLPTAWVKPRQALWAGLTDWSQGPLAHEAVNMCCFNYCRTELFT